MCISDDELEGPLEIAAEFEEDTCGVVEYFAERRSQNRLHKVRCAMPRLR